MTDITHHSTHLSIHSKTKILIDGKRLPLHSSPPPHRNSTPLSAPFYYWNIRSRSRLVSSHSRSSFLVSRFSQRSDRDLVLTP
ncbi:hypothetical protein KSS87_021209 [Heliosperma pusillum]|nr:hypothetical protein KSS87_021384 [Heliosperma pusillum]KAH9613455.1 hypothetical protein KSS87_021209 [Heliosperma pusillum]